MMKYKGYVGCSEVNEEAGLIFGEAIGLRDVITYQGRTAEEARKSFEESVDLYLQTCAEEGIDPDKSYSGKLLIRTKGYIHRALVAWAKSRGESLNTLTDKILTTVVRKVRMPSIGPTVKRKKVESPKVSNASPRRLAARSPQQSRRKRKKAT